MNSSHKSYDCCLSVLFENIPNGFLSRRKSISTGILLQRPEQARYCEHFTAFAFTLNAFTHTTRSTNILTHIRLDYITSYWSTCFPRSPIIVNWWSIMRIVSLLEYFVEKSRTYLHAACLYNISNFERPNKQFWMC